MSARFSSQLRELIAQLDATGLHFVRCIKPNNRLAPGQFDSELVLNQLRCCGVLEVARVSRAGYPTRYPHAAFYERYKVRAALRLGVVVWREGGGAGGVRAMRGRPRAAIAHTLSQTSNAHAEHPPPL